MFPIFLWVEKYKGFRNFQINLDNEYECSIKTELIKDMWRKKRGKKTKGFYRAGDYEYYKEDTLIVKDLSIKENEEKLIKNFYGENIENVTMIAGKNGVGKSSIFEILTFIERSNIDTNYFIIYKIKKEDKDKNTNEDEDIFLIEGYVTGIDLTPPKKYTFIEGDIYASKSKFSCLIKSNGLKWEFINYPNRTEYRDNCQSSNIALIKYNYKHSIDIKKNKNENDYRTNSRPSKLKYSYNIMDFKIVYEYLCKVELIGKSIENNYKNAVVEIKLKKDDSYRDLNKLFGITQGKYAIDSDEICRKVREKLDITENISEKTHKIVIKDFCNRAYFSQLLDEFEKIYYESKDIKNYIQKKLELIKNSDDYEYKLKTEVENYVFDKIKEIHFNFLKKYKTKSIARLLRELHEYHMEYIEVSIYQKVYIKLYRQIRKLNLFNGKNMEKFSRSNSNKEEISKLLEIFSENRKREYHLGANKYNPEIDNFFEIGIGGCSDGEEVNISLFSKLDWFLANDCYDKKYITLLLDEPDLFLHPELNRKLFIKLLEILTNYKDKQFKLMIATHSPYFLAEARKEDAILLKLISGDNPKIIKNDEKENTFGSNIHDLYKNSFFMESTFGEFAKDKIKKVIEDLKTENITFERKEEIKYIINSIGEPLIRKKLENMLEEYEQNQNNVDEDIELLEKFKKLTTQQKKELLEKNSGDINVEN